MTKKYRTKRSLVQKTPDHKILRQLKRSHELWKKVMIKWLSEKKSTVSISQLGAINEQRNSKKPKTGFISRINILPDSMR